MTNRAELVDTINSLQEQVMEKNKVLGDAAVEISALEHQVQEHRAEISRLRAALTTIRERSDSGVVLSDFAFRCWAASYAECVLEGKSTKTEGK